MTSSLPFLDGGPTAAHRRVDHRNTLCRSLFGDLTAGVGMHGAVDGDDPAGRQSGQHPGLAVEHFSDVVVADDAQADEVAGGGQLGRGPAVFAAVSAYGSRLASLRAHKVVS